MQDKYTHHTSQSSPADLGWERMAALLDAEMPAQVATTPNRSKKRGLIWLWLLTGIVIMAGAAVAIYQQKRPSLEPHQKPATEGFNPAIAQVESSVETDFSAAEKHLTLPESTIAISPSAIMRTPSLIQYKNASVISDPLPPQQTLAAVPAMEIAAPVSESILAEQWMPSAPPTNHRTIASPLLQSVVPAGLQYAQPNLDLDSPLKIKRSQRKKVRLGVELATGIATSSGGIENFSAGAIAVWKPGALVAARTGLLAGSNSGDLYMPTAARQSLANEPNGTLFDNSTPLNALESRAFSGQTYRFQAVTLQLPAILSYYLSPRLSVEGGLTAGLLLNLQNVSEATGEADQFVNTGSSPTANFSQAQLSSAVSNTATRFELLASAGLRCQITPKFSIGLHYQHGLNDLLPDSSLQAMQRNVRLSGAMLF